MTNINFKQIDRARKLLGLHSEATLKEIREAYYRKAKEHHPDRYTDKEKKEQERKMAQINQAYKILLSYLEKFEFSFKKEDVDKNDPERAMKRFSQDWLWK